VSGSLHAEFHAQRSAMEAKYGAVLASTRDGRTASLLLVAAGVLLYGFGLVELDISPFRIWHGLGELGRIASLMLPPSPKTHLPLYLHALFETVSIALIGTLIASVLAFPIGFLAARNVVANRVLHFATRRALDTVRSIDTLIWALIWIDVVGLGPFAGALAIACSDLGSLAKLMSEAIETADHRPIDGVLSSGGSRLHRLRFGIIPQILPVFASQVLYFFESNIRSATIIGIVGGGGVGLYLYEEIRVLEWRQVSFLILLVLVTVAGVDVLSQRLRAEIIGRRGT
jgi:phosphonate transport system permease protein